LVHDSQNFDFFFSPRSEFNKKFLTHIIEKEHKNPEKTSKYSEVELLNRIIDTISKEKNLASEYYLRYPNKIVQLTSILHFALFIFCQNKNVTSFSQQLNEIFAEMVTILMKKVALIESILTLIETKEKAKGYNRSFSIGNDPSKYTRCGTKQTTVKEFYQQIDETSHKLGMGKMSSKIVNSPGFVTRFNEKKNTIAISKAKLELISPKANVIKAISNELRNLDTDDTTKSLFSSLKAGSNHEKTGDADNSNSDNSARMSMSNSDSLKKNNSRQNTETNYTSILSSLKFEDENKKHSSQTFQKKSLFGGNNTSDNINEDSSMNNFDSLPASPMSYIVINHKERDCSMFINEDCELDSQFDEMIELMDDMQTSDRGDFIEIETSPKQKPVKITDFQFVQNIGKGGYGRVDIYRKITTRDIYAIKSVNINQMVIISLTLEIKKCLWSY
jgi:hypothetical protein